jgi:glutathione S-transferase
MIELYQTEWCPASHRVRQRLTELGVDYLIHQVPVDKAERRALVDATGGDAVPAVVLDDGTVLEDETAISHWLDAHIEEPTGAVAHRERAARVERRRLEAAALARDLDRTALAAREAS